jgi:hypothetical protein
MTAAPHLPCLRRGRPYESLEKLEIRDHRTGEIKALLSVVNAGVVRKDLPRLGEARQSLKRFATARLVELSARAGQLFLEATLPLGDRGHTQSPQEYIESLSATSGLPWNLARRNLGKIHQALTSMKTVLNGLTRGLPLEILDAGHGLTGGTRCCFYPVTQALGLVMPSNSPGVNSLWLPAIPLRIPVVLKPGREEPWTAYRLIQAFLAAGCPPEAFGFYPTDHEGAAEILRACGRALVFGDKTTTHQYAGNPNIQVHGPGFSKVLIGDDEIENWPRHLDVLAASIVENGGRSCINASAIVVPKHAAALADALAQKLAPLQPLPPQDENARLAGFASVTMAEGIEAAIERDLRTPGATDCAARYRQGPRLASFQGGAYLRPTIVLCDSFAHPLANREFLFPYASVVEVPQSEMPRQIGPSLVVTAITRNPAFAEQLRECPWIDRLNLGPVPTTQVSWDQPHEGNLFEFLYRRRAFEVAL